MDAPHRAPEAHRDAGRVADPFRQSRTEVVRQRLRGLVALAVAGGRQRRAALAEDGRRHVAVGPTQHLAALVQAGPHAHQGHRPVLVVGEVLLPRPHQLDRLANGHAHLHGLADEVHFGLAAKAPAQRRDMDRDLGRRHAGQGHHQRQRGLGRLRRRPDLAAHARLVVHRAVQHFHAGVGDVGQAVARFQLEVGGGDRRFRRTAALHRVGRAGRVAAAGHIGGGGVHQRLGIRHELRAVECGDIGGQGPLEAQPARGLPGVPGRRADHCHGIDIADSLEPARRARRHFHRHHRHRAARRGGRRRQHTAEARAVADGGIHHARPAHVDPVDRAAVHFGRDVRARQRLADAAQLRIRHQRRRSRHRHAGGSRRELAVTHRVTGGCVGDPAVEHRVVGAHGVTHLVHGGADEHLAGDGRRIAQPPEVVARDAGADRVDRHAHRCRRGERGRCGHDAYRGRVHHQVLAQDLGQARERALAHVGSATGQGDAAIQADGQPGVHDRLRGGLGLAAQHEAEREAGAGGEELATVEAGGLVEDACVHDALLTGRPRPS